MPLAKTLHVYMYGLYTSFSVRFLGIYRAKLDGLRWQNTQDYQ